MSTCITFKLGGEVLEATLPGGAWKHQQSDFCVAATNSAYSELRLVFVKRFQDVVPAHSLLLSSMHDVLPSSPALLHFERQNGACYYVFALLDGYRNLNSYFPLGADHSRILPPATARTLLTQVSKALAEINQRGYYHPDVSWRNIMVKFRSGRHSDFALIDVDSCLNLKMQLPSAVTCDQTWWCLYLHKGLQNPAYLNPTMMLSMAMVLFRLHAHGSGAGGNGHEVLLGRPSDQKFLFGLADRGDVSEFIKVFPRASQHAAEIKDAFAIWRSTLQSMQAGRAVHWPVIQQFVEHLMVLGTNADDTGRVDKARVVDVPVRPGGIWRAATEKAGGEMVLHLKTAVDQAPTGATLRLAPGTYELDSALVLRKRLRLLGAGIDATFIIGDTHDYLLANANDELSELSDLTIRRSGGRCGDILRCGSGGLEIKRCRIAGAREESNRGGSGLRVYGKGRVSVKQSVFEQNDFTGIAVQGTANADVEACTFSRNGNGLVFYEDGTGAVRQNACLDNSRSGIYTNDRSRVTLEANVCRGNKHSAIVIAGVSSSAVRRNTCTGNEQHGIYVSDQACPVVEDNTCDLNTWNGIGVCDEAQPALTGNTCRVNKQSGISLWKNAGGMIRRNVCTGNEQHGIYVGDRTQPTLEDNSCQGNSDSGIVYFGTAKGSALRNTCSNNKKVGIYVGQQAEPLVSFNTCQGNEWSGIAYQNNAGGDARDNECMRNKSSGIYVASTAKPRLMNNRCYANQGRDTDDRRGGA